MKQEKYTFNSDNSFFYEFISAGPKGEIKKVVQFIRFAELRTETYNLVMGDWNEKEGHINDLANTNNGDREKVLATVANITVHFLSQHPKANIFATGSTPARNRLYRMGISGALNEIQELFEVKGFEAGRWQQFQKNANYIAFLLYYRE